MTCLTIRAPPQKKNSRRWHLFPSFPSLTASCFQFFSPADQLLSEWSLTRGETNKDSQEWAIKLLQYFSLLWGHELLLPSWPGPFISYDSPGCQQGLWTLEGPIYTITMSSWLLLTKPLQLLLLCLLKLILVKLEINVRSLSAHLFPSGSVLHPKFNT